MAHHRANVVTATVIAKSTALAVGEAVYFVAPASGAARGALYADLTATTGGSLDGIVTEAGALGETATVAISGQVEALSGAAIASPPTDITANDAGRVITAATGHRVHGKAHTTAAGADETVVITLGGDTGWTVP